MLKIQVLDPSVPGGTRYVSHSIEGDNPKTKEGESFFFSDIVLVIAETAMDVAYIHSHFHSLPMAMSKTEGIIWTGDHARFIVANL